MAPPKTVICDRNLYDVYPDTGYTFLAYPQGAEVPEHEYEKLRALNPVVKAETVVTDAEPTEPPTGDVALEEKTRAELLVIAKSRGLDVPATTKKADIIAAITAADEDDGAGDSGDDDTSDEDDGAGEGDGES